MLAGKNGTRKLVLASSSREILSAGPDAPALVEAAHRGNDAFAGLDA